MFKSYLKFYLLVIIFYTFFYHKYTEIKEYKDCKIVNSQAKDWMLKGINQFDGATNYSAREAPLKYYVLNYKGNNSQKINTNNVNNEEHIIEMEITNANEGDLLKSDYRNTSYETAVKHMALTMTKDFT